jgi:hypothetical protein
MTITANDLLDSAALKLGAKATGESLTASEYSDGLKILNSMLDAWAIDKLLVYQILQTGYSWAAAASSRTIGTGGDLSGTRPIRIEEGSFFHDSVNNLDVPVNILRNRSTYDRIRVKNTNTTYPEYLFYDPAYPLGVLYAYPVPSSALTLYLNTWQTLQSFSNGTTALALPPGYQWAIEHNLAIALEPIFTMPAPPSVVKAANTSLAALKRINNTPLMGATEVAHVLRGVSKPNIKAGD